MSNFKVGDTVIGLQSANIYCITIEGWVGKVIEINDSFEFTLKPIGVDKEYRVEMSRFERVDSDGLAFRVGDKVVVRKDSYHSEQRYNSNKTYKIQTIIKVSPKDEYLYDTDHYSYTKDDLESYDIKKHITAKFKAGDTVYISYDGFNGEDSFKLVTTATKPLKIEYIVRTWRSGTLSMGCLDGNMWRALETYNHEGGVQRDTVYGRGYQEYAGTLHREPSYSEMEYFKANGNLNKMPNCLKKGDYFKCIKAIHGFNGVANEIYIVNEDVKSDASNVYYDDYSSI